MHSCHLRNALVSSCSRLSPRIHNTTILESAILAFYSEPSSRVAGNVSFEDVFPSSVDLSVLPFGAPATAGLSSSDWLSPQAEPPQPLPRRVSGTCIRFADRGTSRLWNLFCALTTILWSATSPLAVPSVPVARPCSCRSSFMASSHWL